MDKQATLTLNPDDPRVTAARDAEQRLFDYYGLQAKTHFIPLPGLDLKVRVSEIGTGKPILIVPGNTGDSFPLALLFAQLKGRRLIILNRPGGGLSDGIDHLKIGFRELDILTLATVMDAFELDSVPIVAHSIGAHWSLWMAMDKPQRVSALVLMGVPGNVINTQAPFVLRLLSVPILNKLLFALITPRDTAHSLRGLSFMGHSPQTIATLPQAMADCYYYFQKLPNYRISSLSLMEQANTLFGGRPITITQQQLQQVKQSTLFLWGTYDPFGSAETGSNIAALMSSSVFHAVQNGGHLPWLDAPEECGSLILNFLKDH
jgi:2-hydroxy-6-oxonona-2,4-dienedioate hydrolase